MTAAETGELLRLAEQSGLVHAVNFNIRFYPQCQEARARVRAGEIGDVRLVSRRLPAGLAAARHRLELAARPGRRRRAARGRRHRLALARPRPVHHRPARRGRARRPDHLHPRAPPADRPGGDVQRRRGRETVDAPMETEDAAGILLRLSGGARGVLTVSQVSAGRKNRLGWEIDGSASALAWHSEAPEELWIGHRDRPNELLLTERRRRTRPATPRASRTRSSDLYRAVYARRRSRWPAARAGLPDVRRRPRGGRDRRRDRALARRAALGLRHPRAPGGLMKLGLLTAAFPTLTLDEIADWAAAERLRDARGRLLAGRRGRRAALRRRQPHRCRRRSTTRRRPRSSRRSSAAASRSPRSPTTRTRCARRRARAPPRTTTCAR